MERAKPPAAPDDPPLAEESSKLKEFAVLAFWAEITRLPGHCAPAVYAGERHGANDTVPIDDSRPHLQIETAGFDCYRNLQGCL